MTSALRHVFTGWVAFVGSADEYGATRGDLRQMSVQSASDPTSYSGPTGGSPAYAPQTQQHGARKEPPMHSSGGPHSVKMTRAKTGGDSSTRDTAGDGAGKKELELRRGAFNASPGGGAIRCRRIIWASGLDIHYGLLVIMSNGYTVHKPARYLLVV